MPAFGRDSNGIYAQIVYAAKSTDVVDVMCNGRWLMRDRGLLTLDEDELRRAADREARRIDAFLSSREVSVLQKLVAVGGAVEQESFEVQVKARVPSAEQVLAGDQGEELTVIRRATITSTTPTGRSTIPTRAGCAIATTSSSTTPAR